MRRSASASPADSSGSRRIRPGEYVGPLRLAGSVESDGGTARPTPLLRPVALRRDWAEAVGLCVAQRFEVHFDACGRNTKVARLDPVRSALECPITRQAMRDPVMTCDGHVYERRAIERWFMEGRATSPMTNLELPEAVCVPLMPLRLAIEAYVNRRPELMQPRGEHDADALRQTIEVLRAQLAEATAALGAARRKESESSRRSREAEVRCATAEALLSATRGVHGGDAERATVVGAAMRPSRRLRAAVEHAKRRGAEAGRGRLQSELRECLKLAEVEAADFEEVVRLARDFGAEDVPAQAAVCRGIEAQLGAPRQKRMSPQHSPGTGFGARGQTGEH